MNVLFGLFLGLVVLAGAFLAVLGAILIFFNLFDWLDSEDKTPFG